MANVAFLRDCYRHFHAGRTAGWTDSDFVLREKLDALAHFARKIHEDEAE